MNVLPTINLTGHQKILLAKIVKAPQSPNNGKRVHVDNEKLVSAREFLVKLGIITFDPDTELLNLTDRADVLMQEEGITDESGTLTDLGNQYASGKIPKPTEPPADSMSPTPEKFHISFKDYLLLVESE